jgi:polar amino acid transport system ATP-binding protein
MASNWTQDQPIVECVDVRKSFGDLEVLKGISLSVRKGEVICIIGPSGSGKSTLVRCINALQPISAGSIKVEGIDVSDPKLDKLALRRKGLPAIQPLSAQDGASQRDDGADTRSWSRPS